MIEEAGPAVVCIPLTADGRLDPRWGRAERVAVVRASGASGIESWQEFEVGWGRSHEMSGEGEHHARIARFLKEHGITTVVAAHMGAGMQHMLGRMGIEVHLGATGVARDAALIALGDRRPTHGWS